MPKAVIDASTERFDLETLEGGWVELRVMSYGQYLKRRELQTRMTMVGDQKTRTSKSEIEMLQRQVAQYEFSKCIVDHNLEDAVGVKLDFNKNDTIDALHPKIGEEIAVRIGEMNNYDPDSEGNS